MSNMVEACAECTQRCIQLHGKTKNLSSITSFFKIMFGGLFSKVLFLPPKFAATVPTLVNKEVVLENSLGQQWKVTVSNREGALAFEEGWNAFSSEHSLEIGDIVIFNHVMDLLFSVRIYTKSGCEKIEFSEKTNVRKRTSTVRDKIDIGSINPRGSSFSAGDVANVPVSQDKRHSSQNMNVIRDKRPSNDERHRPLRTTEICDDSYHFIHRNKDVRVEENRSPLVDLFSMESQKNKAGSSKNETNKVAGFKVHPTTLAPMSPSTAIDACLVYKPQIVKKENMEISPLNIHDTETLEKRHYLEEIDVKMTVSNKDSCHDKTTGVPVVTSAMDSDKITVHSCNTPFKVIKECQNVLTICNTPSTITRQDQAEAASQEKHTFPTECCTSAEHEYTPDSLGVQKFLSGEATKIIKEEPLDKTPKVDCGAELVKEIWEPKVIVEELIDKSNKTDGDNNDVDKVVNADNGDSNGIPSPNAAHIFCLEAKDNQSFLVLPTCLPKSKKGRKNMEKKKLVYLRDPGKRLWPIFYHEMPEIQVLTSGWEAFSSANQIQSGDECSFQVEDDFERIYQVSIRKCKK